MNTISVLWPDEFGQEVVNINEADFNPAIHQLPGAKEEKQSGSGSEPADVEANESGKTKAELAAVAESKGIDVKGLTKAEIVDALRAQGE